MTARWQRVLKGDSTRVCPREARGPAKVPSAGRRAEDLAGGRRLITCPVEVTLHKLTRFGNNELHLEHSWDARPGAIPRPEMPSLRFRLRTRGGRLGSTHLALRPDWGPHRPACRTCLLPTAGRSTRCLFYKGHEEVIISLNHRIPPQKPTLYCMLTSKI